MSQEVFVCVGGFSVNQWDWKAPLPDKYWWWRFTSQFTYSTMYKSLSVLRLMQFLHQLGKFF